MVQRSERSRIGKKKKLRGCGFRGIQPQLDPGGNFGTKLYHRGCLALRQGNRVFVPPLLHLLVNGHQFSWKWMCVDVCACTCRVEGRRQLPLLTQKVAGVNLQHFMSVCSNLVEGFQGTQAGYPACAEIPSRLESA